LSENQPRTDELIRQAATDVNAFEQLLVRHQDRLRRMVAVRIDGRLKARLDPSDVVQDVLAEAAKLLPDYLAEKPIAFYPWLRQLAWERVVHLHRTHIAAQRRSVNREQQFNVPLAGESTMLLAEVLADSQSSPSRKMERRQMKEKIKIALESMRGHDRELLVLRYLEQLSFREISEVLGSTEPAIKSRHVRALQRLGAILLSSNNDSQ
jgi:RNA polymerase sigma-70 factor (ECF subfamily)